MTSKVEAAINLDALRAARAEAADATITISLGGQRFNAPRELPYAVLRKVRADDLDGALVSLLGQEQADRLMDTEGLTLQDINAMLEGIVGASTGAPLGEPSGSSRS